MNPTIRRHAINRILALQNQLREEFGLEARCAVELEGFSETEDGIPQDTNLGELASNLLRRFRNVGYIYPESAYEPALHSKFEILIGPGKFNPAAQLMSPLVAAGTTDSVRNAITRHSGNYGLGAANFQAVPDYNYTSKGPNTCGMHVNISLWNLQGNPVFADTRNDHRTDNALLQSCVTELMRLQGDTVLLYAPNQESYRRYGARETSPKEIDLNGSKPKRYSQGSLAIRRNYKHSGIDIARQYSPELTRLENRLAGADADPYLVMVATLAALYEGARKHYHQEPVKDAESTMLPTNLDEAVQRLESSHNARHLLGEKLYDAILSHYQPQQLLGRAAD